MVVQLAVGVARCLGAHARSGRTLRRWQAWRRKVLPSNRTRIEATAQFAPPCPDDATLQQSLVGHLDDGAAVSDATAVITAITEISCWQRCRWSFCKALDTDKTRAIEALAIIARLFATDRVSRDVPMQPTPNSAHAELGPSSCCWTPGSRRALRQLMKALTLLTG
jgi:hypothetical protein